MTTVEQDNAILNKMVDFSEGGASAEEIRMALGWPKTQLRTLQRRLIALVRENKLIVDGATRSKRYKIPPKTTDHIVSAKNEWQIPLSASAIMIREKILQPINLRIPVGYNREFLDQYQPNNTYYLTDLTRRHLLEIGGSHGDFPGGTYAKKILNRLLIDLSWNSSRLEGNTYSLLETERLLKLSEISEGKDLKEAQMILNHKRAIEFLVDSATEKGIYRWIVVNLHAILSNELLGDSEACGRLRSIPVAIAKSVYHPVGVPQLIDECFQQIIDKANKIQNPFEQSFFLMVHLPYLQPFEDVNKRTSRLVANIPLAQNNLSPLSFVDVPVDAYVQGLLGVYELNRIELFREVFIWAYERSCLHYSAKRKELGEPNPFRIRYSNLIEETIVHIIRNCLNRVSAIEFIKQKAHESVPKEFQMRFIEVVESEIMFMREDNFARYRLSHPEFLSWRNIWDLAEKKT